MIIQFALYIFGSAFTHTYLYRYIKVIYYIGMYDLYKNGDISIKFSRYNYACNYIDCWESTSGGTIAI